MYARSILCMWDYVHLLERRYVVKAGRCYRV